MPAVSRMTKQAITVRENPLPPFPERQGGLFLTQTARNGRLRSNIQNMRSNDQKTTTGLQGGDVISVRPIAGSGGEGSAGSELRIKRGDEYLEYERSRDDDKTGKIIWEDSTTSRTYDTVNGIKGQPGGGFDGMGPTIAGGMMFVTSGNNGAARVGSNGVNVLLAYSVDGKLGGQPCARDAWPAPSRRWPRRSWRGPGRWPSPRQARLRGPW